MKKQLFWLFFFCSLSAQVLELGDGPVDEGERSSSSNRSSWTNQSDSEDILLYETIQSGETSADEASSQRNSLSSNDQSRFNEPPLPSKSMTGLEQRQSSLKKNRGEDLLIGISSGLNLAGHYTIKNQFGPWTSQLYSQFEHREWLRESGSSEVISNSDLSAIKMGYFISGNSSRGNTLQSYSSYSFQESGFYGASNAGGLESLLIEQAFELQTAHPLHRWNTQIYASYFKAGLNQNNLERYQLEGELAYRRQFYANSFWDYRLRLMLFGKNALSYGGDWQAVRAEEWLNGWPMDIGLKLHFRNGLEQSWGILPVFKVQGRLFKVLKVSSENQYFLESTDIQNFYFGERFIEPYADYRFNAYYMSENTMDYRYQELLKIMFSYKQFMSSEWLYPVYNSQSRVLELKRSTEGLFPLNLSLNLDLNLGERVYYKALFQYITEAYLFGKSDVSLNNEIALVLPNNKTRVQVTFVNELNQVYETTQANMSEPLDRKRIDLGLIHESSDHLNFEFLLENLSDEPWILLPDWQGGGIRFRLSSSWLF